MVQQVLHLPELRIAKPSDTRWLAHDRCVKAVTASYEQDPPNRASGFICDIQSS